MGRQQHREWLISQDFHLITVTACDLESNCTSLFRPVLLPAVTQSPSLIQDASSFIQFSNSFLIHYRLSRKHLITFSKIPFVLQPIRHFQCIKYYTDYTLQYRGHASVSKVAGKMKQPDISSHSNFVERTNYILVILTSNTVSIVTELTYKIRNCERSYSYHSCNRPKSFYNT
jgi:hypothetical protein